MKYFFTLLLIGCTSGMLMTGCIPSSAPPQQTPQPSPAIAPSPAAAHTPAPISESSPDVHQATDAAESSVPIETAASEEGDAANLSEGDLSDTSEISNESPKKGLHINLDENGVPPGAIPLPTGVLQPLEGVKGYRVLFQFPMDGLAMNGTLLYKEGNNWHFSGEIKSNRPAFKTKAPEYSYLGGLISSSEGEKIFAEQGTQVLVTFVAPMPPADSPVVEEAEIIPYSLYMEAPLNAIFNIVLMPF